MCLGFALGSVGLDKMTGTLRMTFGHEELLVGFDFLIAVIGLFGIGEILSSMESGLKFSGHHGHDPARCGAADLEEAAEILGHLDPQLHHRLLDGHHAGRRHAGLLHELRPGQALLQDAAHNFGKGEIEGVVAPETAAHAAGTSALLPMLTLGIPGSPTAAVLLGGLLIWGLQPGPMLFIEQKDFVWGLIASMYLGNIVGLIVVLTCVPLFAAILRVPFSIIAPDHSRHLRGRRLHGAQQHVRRLADAGVRRGRLRVHTSSAIRCRRWCWRSCWATRPKKSFRQAMLGIAGQPDDLLVELAGGNDHDARHGPAVLAAADLAAGQRRRSMPAPAAASAGAAAVGSGSD